MISIEAGNAYFFLNQKFPSWTTYTRERFTLPESRRVDPTLPHGADAFNERNQLGLKAIFTGEDYLKLTEVREAFNWNRYSWSADLVSSYPPRAEFYNPRLVNSAYYDGGWFNPLLRLVNLGCSSMIFLTSGIPQIDYVSDILTKYLDTRHQQGPIDGLKIKGLEEALVFVKTHIF